MNINEHILTIYLINFINIFAEMMKYKETKNIHILTTVCPISFKPELNYLVNSDFIVKSISVNQNSVFKIQNHPFVPP